ncbi:Bug family tripartite tricarboxylate transporter substrate binding protein [Achromobacter aloeverae]|uniref:ABC transporter substrate-binding protein n=1 Tax=Achromobacter aloeverae TaxID=1750518 RepID=A0A4Q1HGE6_9BURK|nr:tripartite tricarboxylate transporter substrate binding protein [Achromobacter aloeverae]RXN85244.1 ABC transporter substrate-binding protein [Achromobacter aloeverae]
MKLSTLIAGAALALAATAANAAWPDHPVRIVVPYPPGGAVDAVTRKVAQQLTLQTGQTFIVDNKAGATGTIGAGQVVHAQADGYTLMANDTTYTTLPFIFQSLSWDPRTALTPVSAFMFAPMAVAVRKESPFHTLQGLLAAARAQPGKVTFGTGGIGTTPHFATEAMAQASHTTLMHVPFKGAGEATVAVLSGTVDFQIASTPGVIAQVQNGTMRLLAISGEERLKALPDVPTFRQAGLDDEGVINFTGLWAPKGTPMAVQQRLQAEVAKAMASPDMQRFAATLGADPRAVAGEDFQRMVAQRQKVWEAVSRQINLQKQ